MNHRPYYHNCSPDDIASIDPGLHGEIETIIRMLPQRETPSKIKEDLFWLFTQKAWCFDTIPANAAPECPFPIDFMESIEVIRNRNLRDLCLTSSTMDTRWHSDYAKRYGNSLVQVEAQFGNVDAMLKDFCGFRIAYAERRLALGIEIVLVDPPRYDAHPQNTSSDSASFDIAKHTLATIGLECPIWLVGIAE